MVPRKKWVTFTHFSPLVRLVTNLFKQTILKLAFLAINTIEPELTKKQNYNNPVEYTN
jgi:hypothetical protein